MRTRLKRILIIRQTQKVKYLIILEEIQINKSLREYYEYFLKIINQENNINYLEQQLLFSNQTREVDISNDYISYLIESFIENDNSYEIIISNKEECSISDWFIESNHEIYCLNKDLKYCFLQVIPCLSPEIIQQAYIPQPVKTAPIPM